MNKIISSKFYLYATRKLRAPKSKNVFLHVFGDKSLEQAKAQLKAAWERAADFEIKAKIERRLLLLEPKVVNQIKCSGCGKLFQPRQKNTQEQFLRRIHEEKVWNTNLAFYLTVYRFFQTV